MPENVRVWVEVVFNVSYLVVIWALVLRMTQRRGEVVEQVIRPTGLLDPVIEIVPASQQVPHLSAEIEKTVATGQRVLVTTLTKKMAKLYMMKLLKKIEKFY